MTTSPNNPTAIFGKATVAAPSYTEGDQVQLSTDLAGNLRVDATIIPAGTQDVNLAQVAGATVGTGHGTAAGTIRVELPTDGTGVIAGVTTVGAVTAITNALPAGSNLLGSITGSGTAGTPAAGVLTVQGAASTTPILIARAPVSTAALGIVPVVSTALETGHVIKASAGNLFAITVLTTTAAGIVLVFDSTTVPAAGAVTPKDFFQVPAASTVIIGYDPPLQCATGISLAFSTATTPFTKTDSPTAAFSGKAV